MTNRHKAATYLTTSLLIALTMAGDIRAESSRYGARVYENVLTCVAEIGKRASYDAGARVLHRVTSVTQRNLVEMEIRIDTTVYANAVPVRAYSAACVTDRFGNPVKVWVDAIDTIAAPTG